MTQEQPSPGQIADSRIADTRFAAPRFGGAHLWVKLLVAFVLVAVVAVGLVAVLANRVTTHQFQLYVSQGRQLQAERLAPDFVAYYGTTGSWQGVADWMATLTPSQVGGRGPGRGRGLGAVGLLDRLVLADANGLVIADTEGTLVGHQLSTSELSLGAPITVNGQQVGTLIIPSADAPMLTLENAFLERVNRSLVWAGLAAGGVALILGLLFARQLTAPLRTLTQAAHRLARGETTRVAIRSQDEIGELGQAFDSMALALERQQTLRRNLMADIAHELRTPLTVMRGDLEALLDGVFEPSPEALASLQEETLLLSRLVDDLRALAQAEAGQLHLEKQRSDVTDLLRGVVASFDLQAQMQGQTLALDAPTDLPALEVDPQRIRQVVANLVSNALRHAAESGRVEVGAAFRGNEVEISVSDNGPGIPAQDLAHVFDRFWRGGGVRAEGSGLGLAIARELVRAHGGRIWVTSTPGEGSTFWVALPVEQSNTQVGTG